MSQACLDWATSWVDRWAARKGDTPKEKVTKRVFTTFLGPMSLPFALAYVAARNRGSPMGQWVMLSVICCCLPLFVYMRVVRRASPRFVAVASSVILAGIVLADFVHSAEANRRPWPAIILLVDLLLVAQANEFLTIGIVAFMCAYLVVIQLEQWLRFGLYDLPILAPYENRSCKEDCAKPPCPRSAPLSANILCTNLLIFTLDFYFTRGFALQVQREKDKIAASVTAAEQVAERLASLDLDAAEAVLQGSEDVPPGLCESLYTILSHLRCYKPFLPQAVMLPVAAKDSTLSFTHEDVVRTSSDTPTPSLGSVSSVISKDIREICIFRLVVKSVSLLHLHPSLPVVDDTTFLASHSQVLEAVLKQAVSCKGVVDHFCGDGVSLSYNASASCASHAMMAVQTAAALCLNKSHGACELRGAVVTGKAHVGVLGVPELRRHCIVGRLATVCRNIGEGAGILGHRLLCSHTTAVDVACVQPTRVLLDRFVFDTARHDDSYNGVAGVVHEVLARCVKSTKDKTDVNEWMYELAQLSTDEWDVYNKAGCAFVCEGNGAAALEMLHTGGVTEEKLALFNRVAAAARVLDFRTHVGASGFA